MSLFKIFEIASSGVTAQGQRLNATASNLANADSAAGPDGKAYQARQVVFQTVQLDRRDSHAGSQAAVNQVGRIKLVNPEESSLTRSADGLFRVKDGDATADPTVRLNVGAIEGSNVNPVEAMVSMIAVARQFEVQMKMLSSADENARQATKLLASG